jgi:RNA polymerase sigma-70 factor (ECF subfamily)
MGKTMDIKPVDRIFNDNRERMLGIGYRMLGAMTEAEDVVQDAYLRWSKHWQQAQRTVIENHQAFLTSVVTRLCLDKLRRRKIEKHVYVGPWLPEPLPTEEVSLEQELSQWQSVQTALLVMLESLSPRQRAVFTLAEMFDYSHQEIADLLDITPANSRQLLRRAKRDMTVKSLPQAGLSKHTPVFEKFYEALAVGDMDTLESMLCEDVVAYNDGGGKASAAIIPLEGIDRVATVFGHVIRKRSEGASWHWQSVNGQLGLVMTEQGVVTSVTTFAMKDEKIFRIYVTRNPEKLQAFTAAN